MNVNQHGWVRARIAAWRSGLLSEDEAERVVEHLAACADCTTVARAFETADTRPMSEHVPASLMARWPEARETLRGLERAMVRRHLERCAECRQDLELLGHVPRLVQAPELEREAAPVPSGHPAASASSTPPRIRLVLGRRRRERALLAWATLSTAAAAVAIVALVRRPVVEGMPSTMWATLPPPAAAAPPAREGITVRLAPRPRSLKGPVRGTSGGKVTVIPVVGPVGSLALSVRPLDVPDTSMVQISLLGAQGDTLLAVRHRQWEFLPRQVLVIDGGRLPLEPGPYVLELASLITEGDGPVRQMYRYPFELRSRNR